MEKRKINRVTHGRNLTVPVNGQSVYIVIDEDFDVDRYWDGPVKVRCEGPNGLKSGSVVGMLQMLGLSADEILGLREQDILRLEDFNNIGAPYEPFEPELYYPPTSPAKPSVDAPYSPPQVSTEELSNFDNLGPEKLLNLLDRVQRRVQWEVLKEESREEIAWFLENLDKANIAPRCAHVKADGSSCRAPAIKDQSFCHWHTETRALRLAGQQPADLELPVVEDRFALQLSIMRVCDLLTSKAIDPYTARTLFQGLRLAERTLNKRNSLPRRMDPWKAAERAARRKANELAG